MFATIRSICRFRHISLICIILFSMAALVACGGGGGGSSSGSSNTAPAAAITSPLDGNVYTYGEAVTFTGSGSDDEDGELTGKSLVWASDLDGSVGTGASITLSDLSWGDHAITLTAIDSNAETGSDNIYVSVKAWSHPADLDDNISPDEYNAYKPQVAMDGNGNAVITWYQYGDCGDRQIFISEYRDETWSHPDGPSDNISPDEEDAYDPQIAMDDSGNVLITWQQNDGSYNQIFKSEYRNGTWTHPTGLSDNISSDLQNAWYPQVAMDNNGNAIITWDQYDGSDRQIFKSEYRDGEWTHPTGLADNISVNGFDAYNPQVAMDNNGNAVITWWQSDGSTNQIFKSEYRNGEWTHPSGLSDNISTDGYSAYNSRVAMDDNGNTIITWKQSDSAYERIFKSEYRNGTWTYPSGITDNISPDGHSAYYPRVAMDDNGNAVITWYQYNSSSIYQIFMSEYRNGAWTHPNSLADNISPDGGEAEAVQVAMDNNGNAVITWQQYNDNDKLQIFKSEYRNGAWTHPNSLTDNISPDEQRSAFSAQVAADDSGNAVITWCQTTGGYEQIFMSEYN